MTINKLLSVIKKHLGLIALIIIGLLLGGQFPSTYWAFVDDGELIQVSQRMNASINLLFKWNWELWLKDPALGRFRPAYWLYHWLVYNLSNTNHIGHGLIHILLLIGIIISLYLLTLVITNNTRASFLAGLFFLLNTINQENWYRLGPQETPMLFFLALSILSITVYLKKTLKLFPRESGEIIFDLNRFKNIFTVFPNRQDFINLFNFKKDNGFLLISAVLIVPAYFMKESSAAILALPVALYIWSSYINTTLKNQIRPKMILYLLINILLCICVLYSVKHAANNVSYAANYKFSIGTIISSLKSYSWSIWITFEPIILFTITVFLVDIYKLINAKNKTVSFRGVWLAILALLAVSFFAVQLPWEFTINRYLLPVMFFLSPIFAIQVNKLISFFEVASKKDIIPEIHLGRSSYVGLYAIWAMIILVFVYNFAMMTVYINRIECLSNNFNRPLINYLANNLSANGKVYLDTPPDTALELKQEIGLHLQLFFNRNDVRVAYFQSSESAKLAKGDILLRAGEFRQVSSDKDFKNGKLSEPKKVNITVYNVLYYPPVQFVKDYFGKWVWAQLTDHNLPFSPVLAESQDHYYWTIYKIEK